MTGRNILVKRLKAKIMEKGRDEVFKFTGVCVKDASDEEVERVMDSTLDHMSKEMTCDALQKYGLMPWYEYSGPLATGIEPWEDMKAYEKKERKAPTGSITINHPEIKMMCRVTDNPFLPGFIITCKDNDGNNREFHIYLSPAGPSVRVCTSLATNNHLDEDRIIRENYAIPFIESGQGGES